MSGIYKPNAPKEEKGEKERGQLSKILATTAVGLMLWFGYQAVRRQPQPIPSPTPAQVVMQPTATNTAMPSPTYTLTLPPTLTPTPKPTPTNTPKPTSTSTPRPTPTRKPTSTPRPTPTPRPTSTLTPTPLPTSTPAYYLSNQKAVVIPGVTAALGSNFEVFHKKLTFYLYTYNNSNRNFLLMLDMNDFSLTDNLGTPYDTFCLYPAFGVDCTYGRTDSYQTLIGPNGDRRFNLDFFGQVPQDARYFLMTVQRISGEGPFTFRYDLK